MSHHPLGYDPDPAARGEGSSTGRRRRDEPVADAPPRKKRVRRYDADDDNDYCPPGAGDCTPRTKLVLRLPPLASLSPQPESRASTPLPSPPLLPRLRLLIGGGKPRKAKRGGSGEAMTRASRSRATRSRRTSATPTTLESIAAEAAAIKAEVTRIGLVLRDVNADGNCLFRALGDQVWGEQGRHAEVRTLVCNYLDSARGELGDFVAGFLNEGEDYADYVSRMRGHGVYGSHIELLAATKVFKRSIRIILAQTSYTVEYVEGEAATTAKRRTRRTRKNAEDDAGASATAPTEPATPAPTIPDPTGSGTPIPPPRPGFSLIWLALFADAEHYESVRKGGASGPAEVPDSLAVPHARDVSEAARRERGEVIEGDGKDKDKAAAKADSRLAQLLASLPAGHGVSPARATGVLARTKGDIGAAVEILLEDLEVEAECGSDMSEATSSTHSVTGTSSEAETRPPEGRITRSRSSLLSRTSSVDVNAYRDRASSPSSSEASAHSSTSTPPTSPLSESEDDKVSRPLTRSRGRGRGRGRPRRGRASKM